jgi:NitT/TauT family transport system ATP-binding protein
VIQERPALRVAQVSHVFETITRSPLRERVESATHVLADVSFEVRESEFLSIIGPSGCGKTTLLRMLGGLIRPSVGHIFVGDRRVEGIYPEFSMVFQHAGLLPWLTAQANVELAFELQYHRRVTADERARTRQMLTLVGLAGFEGYYPRQLSGGMQQRLGLARALVKRPRILLMDEPFGALDAITRRTLQDELLRIRSVQDTTVVFVTHDIDEAMRLSDRVLILQARPGRVRRVMDVDLGADRIHLSPPEQARFIQLREEAWEILRATV